MTKQPTIRFFCSADASESGLLALALTEAMITVGLSVRLIAIRAVQLQTLVESGRGIGWGRFRGLFLTPLDGKHYVNLVCGDPWDQKRLYTVGVKNVLVTAKPPPPDAGDCRVAIQYQSIIVPTQVLADQWTVVGGHPVVVPMQWSEHAVALKDALSG